jgi:hypothetical protein
MAFSLCVQEFNGRRARKKAEIYPDPAARSWGWWLNGDARGLGFEPLVTSSLKIISLMTGFPLLTNPSCNGKHKPSQRIVGATSGLLTLLYNIVVNTTLLLKWSRSRHVCTRTNINFFHRAFGTFDYELVQRMWLRLFLYELKTTMQQWRVLVPAPRVLLSYLPVNKRKDNKDHKLVRRLHPMFPHEGKNTYMYSTTQV